MEKIVRITSVLIVKGDERRRVKTDSKVCLESLEDLRNFAKVICAADNILFNIEEFEPDRTV